MREKETVISTNLYSTNIGIPLLTVAFSSLLEEVLVDLLDLIGLTNGHTQVLIHHEGHQSWPVNQHKADCDLLRVLSGTLCEVGRVDEHSPLRLSTLKRSYEGLDVGTVDRRSRLMALGLHPDKIKSERVLVNDPVKAGITAPRCHYALALGSAVCHGAQQTNRKFFQEVRACREDLVEENMLQTDSRWHTSGMGRLPVVAVVDHQERRSIVWQVNMEVRPTMPARLVGAWVLQPDDDSTLRLLVTERYVWATEAGAAHLERNAVEVDARADAELMVHQLRQYRESVHELYEAYKDGDPKKRKNLVPPRFSDPDPFPSDPAGGGVRLVDRALTVARWFDSVANIWEDTDAQRTSRKYMRSTTGGDPMVFPLPQTLGPISEWLERRQLTLPHDSVGA